MATEVIIDAMPFDSREVTDPETGDVYYDRIHSAEDFAQWLSTFFGNGIVVAGSQAISSELRVTSSGLVVTVEPGAIVINGRTGWVSTNLSLDISAGGQTGRWDRVVAELNIPNDRQISIKVVQGTNSAPPSLVRTGNVYQLSLAKLRIEAGSASAVVTDERSDLELCGPSNVLVGVQIPEAPTGDTATNIAISDALAQAYELTNPNKNVEKALDKLKNSISVVVSVNGRTGAVTVQEKITASGLLKGDGNGGVTPNGTVSVEQGGTGATTLASGGLLKGNGQGAIGTLSGVGALFALVSGNPQFGTLPVSAGGTGQTSVDGTPTQDSQKLITSGGVFAALANYLALAGGTMTGNIKMSNNKGIYLPDALNYIGVQNNAPILNGDFTFWGDQHSFYAEKIFRGVNRAGFCIAGTFNTDPTQDITIDCATPLAVLLFSSVTGTIAGDSGISRFVWINKDLTATTVQDARWEGMNITGAAGDVYYQSDATRQHIYYSPSTGLHICAGGIGNSNSLGQTLYLIFC